MKKILSLALAGLMLVSMIPTAFAAETTDYTNGTAITLTGSQEESAGGAGDTWTVTVPAALTPGQTGTVKAEGMWNSDKFLNVGAPDTVTLTYGAQTMDVAISWANGSTGFSLIGSSTEEVSKEVEITVADASTLFGTWTGILEYSVDLIEKGDVNRDGVITDADRDAVAYHLLQPDMDGYKELTAEELIYADVDGNGTVTSSDQVGIAAVILGKYYPHAINGTAATE